MFLNKKSKKLRFWVHPTLMSISWFDSGVEAVPRPLSYIRISVGKVELLVRELGPHLSRQENNFRLTLLQLSSRVSEVKE